MSDIPVWTCEFETLPKGEGRPVGAADDMAALTVGDKFAMKCHGDIAVAWPEQTAPPHLGYAKKDDAHSLQILKVQRQDPNDAQYIVTAYKAGEHAPEFVRVLQGSGASETGFEVTKPKWAVKSVLDPKQPPKPYGEFGPWNVPLPYWFLIAVGLTLALVVYLVFRKLRKVSQRRRMMEGLKLHSTATPPLHEFYREARLLQRRLHTFKERSELQQIAQDLDKAFRLFVLRRFQIPTLQWSNRAILDDLRRRRRKTYRAGGDGLKKTLRELDKMKARANAEVKDLEQLYRMSLETAEKLESGGQA